ncbi:hypothetical protein C8R43DRAFT_1116286 [Mycena crocata]|nr:hypothetical protein C8R43DRAFT_1116286 [Mycena crocata]
MPTQDFQAGELPLCVQLLAEETTSQIVIIRRARPGAAETDRQTADDSSLVSGPGTFYLEALFIEAIALKALSYLALLLQRKAVLQQRRSRFQITVREISRPSTLKRHLEKSIKKAKYEYLVVRAALCTLPHTEAHQESLTEWESMLPGRRLGGRWP